MSFTGIVKSTTISRKSGKYLCHAIIEIGDNTVQVVYKCHKDSMIMLLTHDGAVRFTILKQLQPTIYKSQRLPLYEISSINPVRYGAPAEETSTSCIKECNCFM